MNYGLNTGVPFYSLCSSRNKLKLRCQWITKLLTLFVSTNVKAVSCSLDVSINLVNVFIEDDQLYSYVNEKLGAGI